MDREAQPAPSKADLAARLALIQQAHLLNFWDDLSPAQQAELARQVGEIDVDQFRALRDQHRQAAAAGKDAKAHWAELAARAQSPPAMRLDGSGAKFTMQAARDAGAALLKAGKVGMILVAGGLGTRLGFDQPKGMFPIGPLSQRTLFEVLIDGLRAARGRYGVAIPLYVMTSPATDEVTRQFLADHDYFGLHEADVHFFCQATMWAVSDNFSRILLESPGTLFLGPDGHGGMLAALKKSGCLADAQRRGITQFFYCQIDNPLTQICDELTLGAHLLAGSEMTTQVVRKRQPLERVGNVVAVDGRVQVLEYSDLPDASARQTNADGSLKLWAGSLAVHVMSADFLARCAGQPDALPFHTAHKKVAHLDERRQITEPDKPNAIRFERFIFDLLPLASHALVVEVDAAEAFAPVKNSTSEPTDNPSTATTAMIAQARRRLREAGVKIADDVPVEINPVWAETADEIRRKIKPGTVIDRPTYFGEDGPHLLSPITSHQH